MRFEAHPLGTFMALEFPRADMVIEDVVAAGAAVLLSGREKSGKGWFVLNMAICVATDRPFLGRPVAQGPVIYLALEEHARTLQERIRMMVKDAADIPLYIVRADGSVEGQEFSLENFESMAALAELMEEIQPALVIIDTLREAHSVREDVSDDMAPILRPLRQLAHQTHTAILVTHHAGKVSGTFRGSTAIRAAFDDEILFTRTDDQTDLNMRGSVRIEGRNVAKSVITVDFNAATGTWRESDDPVVIPEPALGDRILSALESSPDGLTSREIAERLAPISLKTVQNQIPLLHKANAITAIGQGIKGSPRRYVLTAPPLIIEPEYVPNCSGNNRGNHFAAQEWVRVQ